MFCGIVEEAGVVFKIIPDHEGVHLTIKANIVLEDLKIGDSLRIDF